jgi:hypothetical protein
MPRCYISPYDDHVNDDDTSEYERFIDILVEFDRLRFNDYNIVEVSPAAYGFINFAFNAALSSIGNSAFDFDPDYYFCLLRNYPFQTALAVMTIHQAQGSVTDYGYLDLLSRSVKSTIDLPHTFHTTCKSIADSTSSMAFCADRMAAMTGGISDFINHFMERTNSVADQLSKETLINIVEVFLDFISDLQHLATVPMLRWVTYISRILRVFIPDCMSLAINIFNTYVAGIFSAVAQGFDDLIQTLVVVITGTIAMRNIPDRAHVNSMLEYMKVVNLTIPFSKNVTAMLISCFKALPSLVQEWAKRFVPEYVFYQNMLDKYGDVINGVDKFLTYDIDKIYFDLI